MRFRFSVNRLSEKSANDVQFARPLKAVWCNEFGGRALAIKPDERWVVPHLLLNTELMLMRHEPAPV
jgi:hypothetical protein